MEDDAGRKAVRWVPLEAKTACEAQEAFRRLLVERDENRLRHVGLAPTFSDDVDQSFLPRLDTSGKKPDTLTTEKGHLSR